MISLFIQKNKKAFCKILLKKYELNYMIINKIMLNYYSIIQ